MMNLRSGKRLSLSRDSLPLSRESTPVSRDTTVSRDVTPMSCDVSSFEKQRGTLCFDITNQLDYVYINVSFRYLFDVVNFVFMINNYFKITIKPYLILF